MTTSITSPKNQALPNPSYPFVDENGRISTVWFQFLNSLFQRTGGSASVGSVQSVTVNSGSGIISSVSNPTTTTQIDLSLGAITPSSVASSGPVSGTTGLFPNGLSTLGTMQFGQYVASATTATGYITILDIHGNIQKLIVSS